MQTRIHPFTLMRIRIPLLFKVREICEHYPGRPRPPRFYFELLKVFNFDYNADLDPDPAFHAYAEPDQQPCVLLYTVPIYTIYKFSLFMFSFNLLVVPYILVAYLNI
jgi:hypothetical protein